MNLWLVHCPGGRGAQGDRTLLARARSLADTIDSGTSWKDERMLLITSIVILVEELQGRPSFDSSTFKSVVNARNCANHSYMHQIKKWRDMINLVLPRKVSTY